MLTQEEKDMLDHFEVEYLKNIIRIVHPTDDDYDDYDEYESDLTQADLALLLNEPSD